MTALHIAATTNDVHVVDFILEHVDNPSRAVNIKTNDGWTPGHFAGFFNNFDSLNLLLEAGADVSIHCNKGLTAVDEIVRNDHKDLFECVFPYAKKIKRDTSVVSLRNHFINYMFSLDHLATYILLLGKKAPNVCSCFLKKLRNLPIRFVTKLIERRLYTSQFS